MAITFPGPTVGIATGGYTIDTPTQIQTVPRFNGQSNMNTVVYWGQGANQERLRHYCDDDGIDIVALAFLNIFPDQSGGFPGTNFGNQCGSQTFVNRDGTPSPLLSHCPDIGPDIQYCQNQGKTVLLSLGGASPNNQEIHDHESAVRFADFLWQAFGPQDTSSDVPRPFGDACVDGFDFDIESVISPPRAEHRGYSTIIDTLRTHFDSDRSKTYYISGAPQCVIPDAHLTHAIEGSWFDFLFVQFYNTPECSARSYFDHNYGGHRSDISYNDWVDFVQTRALNREARIFLGLPASQSNANDEAMYLDHEEAREILEYFQCKHPDQFGGVMIYDAVSSDENRHNGRSYAGSLKEALKHNDNEQCASNHRGRHGNHRGNHHDHHSRSSTPSRIGPFPTGGFPGVFPTGGVPIVRPSGGVFPTGGVPIVRPSGGIFPTGSAPIVSPPRVIVPTGGAPISGIPIGGVPTGGVSTGTVIPSATESPSSSAPSTPTIVTSRMPYPMTNSSSPANTQSQSQTTSSENSSPTTTSPVTVHTQAPSQAPQTTQEVVVTEIVTSYLTTCPVAHTITSAGRQVVSTGTTTTIVTETITSTICTKCVAPQQTAAPASSSHGSSNSGSRPGSHNQSPGQGSISESSSPNSESSHTSSNGQGAMSHGAGNVQTTPGSHIPAQAPAEPGQNHGQPSPSQQEQSHGQSSPSQQGQSQGQSSPSEQEQSHGQSSPSQQGQSQGQSSPSEQEQSHGQSSPAENGSPNQVASTINFVPIQTMTVVPVPKYPYQTAQTSPFPASNNATKPTVTTSAGSASGTGAQTSVQAFKGAASRTSTGVVGVLAMFMALVVVM